MTGDFDTLWIALELTLYSLVIVGAFGAAFGPSVALRPKRL